MTGCAVPLRPETWIPKNGETVWCWFHGEPKPYVVLGLAIDPDEEAACEVQLPSGKTGMSFWQPLYAVFPTVDACYLREVSRLLGDVEDHEQQLTELRSELDAVQKARAEHAKGSAP